MTARQRSSSPLCCWQLAPGGARLVRLWRCGTTWIRCWSLRTLWRHLLRPPTDSARSSSATRPAMYACTQTRVCAHTQDGQAHAYSAREREPAREREREREREPRAQIHTIGSSSSARGRARTTPCPTTGCGAAGSRGCAEPRGGGSRGGGPSIALGARGYGRATSARGSGGTGQR